MINFEDFEELARNCPRKEQDTIFVLSRTVIDELPERCRQHYPEYEITRDRNIGYFHTLEDAESAMRKHVEKVRKSLSEGDRFEDETFCYEIKERPIGELGYACAIVSHRVYDADGCFLEQTLCASGCFTEEDYIYGIFRGRTEEQMRFKPGDIVEVVNHNKVSLGFVVCQPLSVEDCWRMWQRHIKERETLIAETGDPHDAGMPEYFGCDDSDDCYIVLTTSQYISHSHEPVTDVFAPHFPIPNYIRKRLETAYRRFVEKELRA